MPGYHSAVVIAEAAMKGFRGSIWRRSMGR